MNDWELIRQFKKIQEIKRKSRKRRYRRSRLDKYRREIEVITDHGASWRDIATWLRQERRIKVHPTTVGRAIDRWRGDQDDEA